MRSNELRKIMATIFLLGLLPIWRSGEKYGLSFSQFIREHTIFAPQRQWIELIDANTRQKVYVEMVSGEVKHKMLYLDEDEQGSKGELTGYVSDMDYV